MTETRSTWKRPALYFIDTKGTFRVFASERVGQRRCLGTVGEDRRSCSQLDVSLQNNRFNLEGLQCEILLLTFFFFPISGD